MKLVTLPQCLFDRADEMPRAIAQRHKCKGVWRTFNWGEVAEIVLSLAVGLRAHGLGAQGSLVIVGDNNPYFFWAALAAQTIGAQSVALYPDVTAAELEFVCHDAGARMVIAEDQEQVDKLLEFQDPSFVQRIFFWEPSGLWSYRDERIINIADIERTGRVQSPAERDALILAARAARADEIACLSYTSGTTGKPKGVICTHKYLLDNAQRLLSTFVLLPGDDYVSYLPFAWATEQYLAIALALSLPLVVNFAERPDQIPEAVREIAPHCLIYGARQWESWASEVHTRMLDAPRWRQALVRWAFDAAQRMEDRRRDIKKSAASDRILRWLVDGLALRGIRDHFGLTRIRAAAMGGTAMAPDAFRFFHALGVPLRNSYGCSEVGVLMAHQNALIRVDTIGSLYSVDPQFGPPLQAKLSPSGELLVCGGSGFSGYWRQPQKTEEKLLDGWFRTGDIMNEVDGEYVYIDRADDMGELADGSIFSPQFLEIRLRFSPFIKEALVVGDITRPTVTALVNINGPAVTRWAEARQIEFAGFTDLSQHVEVIELVRQEIGRVNKLLPVRARISRFANFPKELHPDDGELTRTRKLRRDTIERRYSALIDALYSKASHCQLELEISFQDGQRGILKSDVTIRDIE